MLLHRKQPGKWRTQFCSLKQDYMCVMDKGKLTAYLISRHWLRFPSFQTQMGVPTKPENMIRTIFEAYGTAFECPCPIFRNTIGVVYT